MSNSHHYVEGLRFSNEHVEDLPISTRKDLGVRQTVCVIAVVDNILVRVPLPMSTVLPVGGEAI